MDRKKKGEYTGALGTLLVHVLFLILLLLITIHVPEDLNQEGGGVEVMLGNTDMSQGNDDPSLIDVDVMPDVQNLPSETPPAPETASEQDLITQNTEETAVIKPQEETKKKEEVKKKPMKKKPVKTPPQKTEAEKTAEARKITEEKARKEREAAAEAARNRVAGAFGKGASMGKDKGTSGSGKGVEGSPAGNSATGAKSGVGGLGSQVNLAGRSYGPGGIPLPAYTVQDEGVVVVAITVNPQGRVISASIARGTSTVNTVLRNAALAAAKRARFNVIDGVNNQTGTITYTFKLK